MGPRHQIQFLRAVEEALKAASALVHVVSDFHRGQDIVLPSFYPDPSNTKEEAFYTLDIRRVALYFLQQTKGSQTLEEEAPFCASDLRAVIREEINNSLKIRASSSESSPSVGEQQLEYVESSSSLSSDEERRPCVPVEKMDMCYMTVLDLKDSYHLPIYHPHQQYLRVAVQEEEDVQSAVRMDSWKPNYRVTAASPSLSDSTGPSCRIPYLSSATKTSRRLEDAE
ncbi:uncharacterized protein [Ranitomeya imitator]|uniref:uncharacterized protein n=1 Tax=Ranitomeya imitator TaxID=111125 RepID=UPI0037E963AE